MKNSAAFSTVCFERCFSVALNIHSAGKTQHQHIRPSQEHKEYFRGEIEFLIVLRFPNAAVSEIVNVTPFRWLCCLVSLHQTYSKYTYFAVMKFTDIECSPPACISISWLHRYRRGCLWVNNRFVIGVVLSKSWDLVEIGMVIGELQAELTRWNRVFLGTLMATS